ncbi:MAG TPA: Hpt domain-containing protein [Thermoanaerobaculia bacterium]|nr:Hpt domain-containing protein [Thermoanaerobaculia bacterium]
MHEHAAGTMVDRELEALKREFLTEAKAKVEEIASMTSGPRDSESLDRLAYLAHQLKGSGGSYGYARISDDAADIERAVELITTGEDREATLREKTESLRTAVDQAFAELR